ncbi:hypothetical protein JOC86_000236 [Bacillus pakistanensis]|uniref:Copper transporter n=1 Tax=Rossellomorea pakistanensis TaxID=992288 RepID=A0ABS2N7E9_9BACI|nr:hypothetical protein [Bacillus pakistanensis]MBM7583699.1 hypothetical protein [Bacillus pakistanensis]
MSRYLFVFFTGNILLVIGIYFSTINVVVGTLMGILGGMLMGGSSIFLPSSKRIQNSKT